MRSFATAALLLASVLARAGATPVATAEEPYSTPHPFIPDAGAVEEGEGDANATLLEGRDLRTPLPNRALEIEHRFQPVLDFDKDGCYYTAHIDAGGNKNNGLPAHNGVPPNCLRHTCRDANRLQNNNLYSRHVCKSGGWCAIMYEYYFEKDQTVCGSYSSGHRHDWENIVIFTQNNKVKRVAPSCHGKYNGATGSPRMQGDRAKVVYHKDGGSTHCFRMAKAADDNIENYTGRWYLGSLVGWTGWPSSSLRSKAMEPYNPANPHLPDGKFEDNLRKASGGQIPGF